MFMPQKGYVHAAKGVCSCRKNFLNPLKIKALRGGEKLNTVKTVKTVNMRTSAALNGRSAIIGL